MEDYVHHPLWALRMVMPFGLMNAPAVFQQYINEVLREALDRYVLVYLDDILIYSQRVDEHITHVRQVLQLLLENHLFVKLEKTVFHARTISFLGFVISHNKLCIDPAKVRAVENWPRPTSMHLVQRFMGFTNFYCTVAAPLIALTRKASAYRVAAPRPVPNGEAKGPTDPTRASVSRTEGGKTGIRTMTDTGTDTLTSTGTDTKKDKATGTDNLLRMKRIGTKLHKGLVSGGAGRSPGLSPSCRLGWGPTRLWGLAIRQFGGR
ncbi:hypothetical protein P4O66_001967 [Electrophorus voltai]|uniref:ribonuclease H n=1 Tax=Electrophorus voltai TaxID=2609070 RepID=A0AAD8ZYN4_9TELE|nr:hypothetical protein P4O66_001967 [Electrophorus voltai]